MGMKNSTSNKIPYSMNKGKYCPKFYFLVLKIHDFFPKSYPKNLKLKLSLISKYEILYYCIFFVWDFMQIKMRA